MDIERATVEDAREILTLQKFAYRSEAAIYGDYSLPPLRQTLEELQAEFEDHTILKAVVDGRTVGSVRAREEGGRCYVGRLIVHPDLQGRGIGAALMREVEARFPEAGRFELFTGHKSERNLHLYERLGYEKFATEKVSEALDLIFLRKTASRNT